MGNHKAINTLLESFDLCISNGSSVVEIFEPMSEFLYTPEKMGEGVKMLKDTKEAFIEQEDEYSEQLSSGKEAEELMEAIDKEFARDRKFARIIFGDQPQTLHYTLGVRGERSRVYGNWRKEIKQFYGNALDDEAVKLQLAAVNITDETMSLQLQKLDHLQVIKHRHRKEMGEAQMATKFRDQKLEELEKWVGEYKRVARIVFEDNPQALEILGIVVKS